MTDITLTDAEHAAAQNALDRSTRLERALAHIEQGTAVRGDQIITTSLDEKPISDRHVPTTREAYDREVTDLEQKIETMRRFDSRTGQEIQDPEIDRLKWLLGRKREEVAEAHRELDRLEEQQRNHAAFRQAAALAEQERNQRIARLEQEELERLEAQERARAIFNSRRKQTGGL